MSKGYVLFNSKAGNGSADESKKLLLELVTDELEFDDVVGIEDYQAFVDKMSEGDYIILSGGDGTLNRFANIMENVNYDGEILYFPCGTGNDFAVDVGEQKHAKPFSVKEYIKGLPSVTVNGKTYRFINGVGYGIDGYCCEVGDKMKAESTKPVNYTAIAIKGLLFHYKPTNAKITVDGVEYTYKKVWLAPTMYGRHYGGGMIPTPEQKRGGELLSTMLFHGSGKLKTLMVFPSIFKGEHVKHEKMVTVLTGREITVEFDRPTALQIDGETILGVTSYTAKAPIVAEKKQKATV